MQQQEQLSFVNGWKKVLWTTNLSERVNWRHQMQIKENAEDPFFQLRMAPPQKIWTAEEQEGEKQPETMDSVFCKEACTLYHAVMKCTNEETSLSSDYIKVTIVT